MRAVDLFAGAGGASYGLLGAGYGVAGLTGAVAVIAAHLWLKANRARLEHDIDLWDERAWQHKGKR